MIWSTVWKTLGALALYAGLHSLLAARRTKRATRRLIGPRLADGLYRLSFNLTALMTLACLLRYLRTLPDQPLYRVQVPLRWGMIGGQCLSLLMVVVAAWQVGLTRISGLRQARELVMNAPISQTPPVQHPHAGGERIDWRGPYRLSSHPANYFALLALLFWPTMTVKWATLALGTLVYMVLGSIHEDHRLLAVYGERYRAYRADVPHLRLWP